MNTDVEWIKLRRKAAGKLRLPLALFCFYRMCNVQVGYVLMKRQKFVKLPVRIAVQENKVAQVLMDGAAILMRKKILERVAMDLNLPARSDVFQK